MNLKSICVLALSLLFSVSAFSQGTIYIKSFPEDSKEPTELKIYDSKSNHLFVLSKKQKQTLVKFTNGEQLKIAGNSLLDVNSNIIVQRKGSKILFDGKKYKVKKSKNIWEAKSKGQVVAKLSYTLKDGIYTVKVTHKSDYESVREMISFLIYDFNVSTRSNQMAWLPAVVPIIMN